MDDETIRGGWIWIWRKALESEVWARGPVAWQVWCWCLMRANWKPVVVPITTGRGVTTEHLNRGEFITGRKSAVEEFKKKIPGRTIYDTLKFLERIGCITQNPASHYTKITVCNYEIYQKDYNESRQPSANHPPTIRQPSNTDKEPNNSILAAARERIPDFGNNKFAQKFSILPLPESLSTGAVVDAWVDWLSHLSHKDPFTSHMTLTAHLQELAIAGPVSAVKMIRNGIAKGLRCPALPFEKSSGGYGKPLPQPTETTTAPEMDAKALREQLERAKR